MNTTQHGRWLHELDETECWKLLATQQVGRFAWCTTRGPVVVPMTYRVDDRDRSIVVRTSAYSALAQQANGAMVAFEVDGLDTEGRRGWSVLVHGRAVFDPGTGEDDPDPWPEGSRLLRVRIPPDSVTGRRIGEPGPPSAGTD